MRYINATLASCLILCFLYACQNTASVENNQGSNEQIIELLEQVRLKLQDTRNIYSSKERIADCDRQLAATQDPALRLQLNFMKAQYLLEYGDEKQAVALLDVLYEQVKTIPEVEKSVLPIMGLAYMRLAERNNCVNNHSTDACIMPIQGKGVHQDKEPARKAIGFFEKLLRYNPNDLDSRWLLNILYMTVGGYPQEVPREFLIPGLDQGGAVTVKPFLDIAPALGLNYRDRSGGIIVEDFDNDGYLDIVNSAWDLEDPMHFFHNNGDGTFSDWSDKSGLSRVKGGLNLTQTDYNNDGWVDIFVLRGAWQGQAGFGEQPNSLLRNNGNGTFSDVTIEAGIMSYQPTQTATWNDFNKDGWLDVFIGNESTSATDLHPCELYINDGKGAFTNVAKPGVLDITVFVKGVTSGDYDNDGWPDIFISSLTGQKILLHNKGNGGPVPLFDNASEVAGFSKETSHTFPTGFFDYDNDGWLDLYTCDYDFAGILSKYAAREALAPSAAHRNGKVEIYHNEQGRFVNVSRQIGMHQVTFAMGSNFGDIDNDGWLDLYFGTGNPSFQSLIPNRLYKNMEGKAFADVTVSSRTGNLQKGHAVAFADLNNNGDQDIFTDIGGAFRGDAYYASFYLNPGQSDNNYVYLQLEGKQTNRLAIGARITLKFMENGVARQVMREVNSGGSFGCSPLRREIGVGKATMIDEITVYWPVSGATQVFKNVAVNELYHLVEGQDTLEKMPKKPLVFKAKDGSMPMCAPAK
jgi:tetratricopeptide (TPR) repeat protein